MTEDVVYGKDKNSIHSDVVITTQIFVQKLFLDRKFLFSQIYEITACRIIMNRLIQCHPLFRL